MKVSFGICQGYERPTNSYILLRELILEVSNWADMNNAVTHRRGV